MRRLIYILLLLLHTPEPVRAQQLLFRNISNSIGLPVHEAYNVMQDRQGYIWISTEVGLCRYNGSSIELFNHKNGLPEYGTYALSEDAYGRVWMVTAANRILYFREGKLHEAPFSEPYRRSLPAFHLTYQMRVDNNGIMTLTSEHHTVRINTGTGLMHQLRDTDATIHIAIDSSGNGVRQSLPVPLRQPSLTQLPNPISITTATGCLWLKPSPAIMISDKLKPRILRIHNGILVAIGPALYRINYSLSYEQVTLPDRIISLYEDKDGGLWAGTYHRGVYYFEHPAGLKNPLVCLSGYSVSGVCEDAEKSLWCTTLEKGVFFCRNKEVLTYNKGDAFRSLTMLQQKNGTVFASYGTGELLRMDALGRSETFKCADANADFSGLLKMPGGWMIYGSHGLLYADDHFRPVRHIKTPYPHSANYNNLLRIGDRIFTMNFASLEELMDNMLIRRAKYTGAARLLYVTGNDNVIAGFTDGLYAINIRDYARRRIQGIPGRVVDVLRYGNDVWIQTKRDGIFRLQGDSAVNISSLLRIPGTIIYRLAADHTGSIWAGTNAGLVRFKKAGGFSAPVVYTSNDGLPADEVLDIAIDSNRIYAATIAGLCSFPLDAPLHSQQPPPVLLRSLFVNDALVSQLPERPVFKHNERNFRFVFDVLTFKKPGTKLVYQLVGADAGPQTVSGTELLLANLSPGSYRLLVYARNSDGIRSTQPFTLAFVIRKPVWLQTWFLAFCLLAVLTFIILLFLGVMRRIKRKEAEKSRINALIASSQLSALQAQMNPHFIFNAINSIQNYILKKEEQAAYNFLAKFSKLIRMVLHHSQEHSISLEEELEMIRLYVALEQMRFHNCFRFQLTIQADIDTHGVTVPVMLIQPYVENAIWHGLMNKEVPNDGRLSIVIEVAGDRLKVVITDNGVGREHAAMYRKSGMHRPVAVRLTERRLHIINELDAFGDVRVEVFDLKDAGGTAAGTRVTIYLPLNY